MNIREKIYNYFTSATDLHVLFVFDPMGMVRNEIEEIAEPWHDGYLYQIFEGDWFSTKVRLATEWKDKRVILVFSQAEPVTPDSCQNFPLMSTLLANMAFHEEDAIAFMQQHGIPMQYADFFKQHITELLRDKFNKILSPYYGNNFSLDYAHRGMLSAYLGSERMLEWYQILARIIILCANEDNSRVNAFFNRLSLNSKIRTNDIQIALKEELIRLVGFSYDELSISSIQELAEIIKYNAITQQLAINEADPYKQLKICDSIRLQRLNSILSAIKENTKLNESFMPAFLVLSKNIKEDVLLSIYGTDTNYSFVSEKLCKLIVHELTSDMYVSPEHVSNRMLEVEDKAIINDSLKQVIDFYIKVCKYYGIANGIETFKLNTPDLYISQYASYFYQLDMFYRQAVSSYAELDITKRTTKVEEVKEKLDVNYASLINELNLEWVRCIKELGTGFETITSVERQPDFYKNHLQNIKLKTVVIVSDAFRYEMAQELLQILSGKKHVATLTPALAMLPTETKYCKPSLLPHQTLVCTGNDLEVDGKVLNSTEMRTLQLNQYNADSMCINYDTLMTLSKSEKREIFKHKLVYVFHNTLDDNCHGCSLKTFASTCKNVLEELSQLITFLHDYANVTEVYVTADHGFLYNDVSFEEKDKQAITEDCSDKKTRYFLCSTNKEEFGISKFPLHSVSAMISKQYVGVPTGTNRLNKEGGDYQFAHGGASLQELIIPILYSKYKEYNTKRKVDVSLMEPTLHLVSSRLKAHLIQSEAVSMNVQELTIQCAVYIGDEPVTPIKTITLNSTDSELSASRIYEVDLTVTQDATSKIMQFKVFKKDDLLNPLIEKNIINNTLIEQDDF